MAKKGGLMIYLDDEQVAWLGEKARQGFKKSGLVRFLISECMQRREPKSPVESKRLRFVRNSPQNSFNGNMKEMPSGGAGRIFDSNPVKWTAKGKKICSGSKEVQVHQKTLDTALSGNFRKENYLARNAGTDNPDAELVAWFYSHPSKPYPKELERRRIEYLVALYNRAHAH